MGLLEKEVKRKVKIRSVEISIDNLNKESLIYQKINGKLLMILFQVPYSN